MSKKRTVNDPEEPRLRRSLTGSQEYQNETYHEIFVNPRSMYSNSSSSTLNNRYEVMTLRGGSDDWARANFRMPNNWKSGKLQVDLILRSELTTSGDFDMDVNVAYMKNDATSATSTDLYTGSLVFANPATAAFANWVQRFTSASISVPSDLDLIFGLDVRRNGSTGSDTLGTVDMYIMGITLTWLPETFRA